MSRQRPGIAGAPPEPLFAAAAERRIRWVSHDRPGYGGSAPQLGRDVASAAADAASIANALGIDRFAVMGHSCGGPHALACAAVLPERVLAAVCISGLAPLGAEGLDWLAGMTPSGAAPSRTRALAEAVRFNALAASAHPGAASGLAEGSAEDGKGAAAELERLTALHESGALDDEEFRAAKARIIQGG